MKTAWGEAKEAAKKFGGKSKEYISEAMKNAWSLLIEVWGITKKNMMFKKAKRHTSKLTTSSH